MNSSHNYMARMRPSALSLFAKTDCFVRGTTTSRRPRHSLKSRPRQSYSNWNRLELHEDRKPHPERCRSTSGYTARGIAIGRSPRRCKRHHRSKSGYAESLIPDLAEKAAWPNLIQHLLTEHTDE